MSGRLSAIGVGIVGSGLQAETYAASLAGHVPDARFVAIWGGSRAAELAEQWGGEAVASAEAVVGHPDVDLVIVTTPNSSHPRYGRSPSMPAATWQSSGRSRSPPPTPPPRAARRAKRPPVHDAPDRPQCRGRPGGAPGARRGLDRPVRMAQLHWTGTSYPVDPSNWRAQPEHGGLFLDVGEHAFDLLAWLVGAEIERVHARVTDFAGQDREASAMAQVEFANGALGQVWISFEIPWPGLAEDRLPGAPRRRDAASSTSTRMARHGCAAPRSSAARRRPTCSRPTTATPTSARGDRWERLVDEQPSDSSAVAVSDLRRIGKFIAHLREIVDGLLGRGPWPTEGHDGVRAIAAVEACRRSSESGRPEPVTALPTTFA